MTTLTTGSPVAASGYSTQLRNNMRQIYQGHLSSHFSSTLSQVPDIINILVSQAYYESRLNSNALGPVIGRSSSIAKDYLSSPAIVNFLTTANPTQIANVNRGLQGLGMGQSLGLNSVRGASAKSGQCLIEQARPDLAGQLCVNPGDDLVATFLGDANLSKALLLQMVVLESKYKAVTPMTGGFGSKGDVYNRVYPSRIAAAIAAYLGLGAADSNGTTPQAYSASIVGGQNYATANGVNLQVAQRNLQQSDVVNPSTNGSGQMRLTPPGC